MAKIVFFCHDTLEAIEKIEYYQQDVLALRRLGHHVIICNRVIDLPLVFDLIYVWWWTHALFPVILSKILGGKSVITGVLNFRHNISVNANDYFARPAWQKWLIKNAIILADMNLFVSKSEYIECSDYFKLKIVDYSPCSVGEEYQQSASYGSIPSFLNICWSGRLNLRRKGVFDILDAAKILIDRGVRPCITLAGKQGDGYNELIKGVRLRGLEHCVNVVGEISKLEKLRLYKESSIYLQPSYYEGFGLASVEAMASGATVITCDVGEVKHVVGDAAIYINPGNALELANAMYKAMTDTGMCSEIKHLGRMRVKNLFSFEAKVSVMREALKRIDITS